MPVLFFVGGVAATGWILTSTDFGVRLASHREPEPIAVDAAQIAPSAQTSSPANPPAVTAPMPDMAARIAAVEARLAQTEATGKSAGPGTSPQLSRIMLAMVARRTIETGRSIGGLESELQKQFGSDAPYLVTAITSATRDPVTLAALTTEFSGLAPSLSGSGDKWWARISNSLSNLVTVRDGKTKSDDPAALVGRADAALKAGKVEAALEAVGALPNRALAGPWMVKAKRYAAAMQAVDALEAKAFAAPPVEAPAPVMTLPDPSPAPDLAPAPVLQPGGGI